MCVWDLIIYVLCLLSSFVPLAHTTSPWYPTEWDPTAQKTGKHLRCGPSELSASLYPPGLGWGSLGAQDICFSWYGLWIVYCEWTSLQHWNEI